MLCVYRMCAYILCAFIMSLYLCYMQSKSSKSIYYTAYTYTYICKA